MPINIYKNNGASILTINNFTNLMIDGNTPTDAWGDISDAETKAILLKSTGPTMQISFEYTLVDAEPALAVPESRFVVLNDTII